ncbi:MAG: DUF6268 family outer membrane beta-barrel protein [Verrucomicrobiales bacterium]|nr:DUF6268 family outer membrane beta-barrel protein [Verrucomicrobiales bacterium]
MTRLLSIAFLSVATLASAEDSAEETFIPNFAIGGSYFSWTGDTDFSNGSGSVSQYEFGVEANAPIVMRDTFRITAGVQYRFNNLDFSGAPLPLGNQSFDLHRVDVPFNFWKDFNRKWKMWVRLQPGWYSDFETMTSDDFILTSLALLSYQLNETTKVAFGAFYSRDLGEERVLPALGVIFEPNAHWSLALTFPRIELAYAPADDWLFTGRAVLSGAGWNITDPAGGVADVDLNYKSVRVGVGAEHNFAGPWWAYLDAGVQLAQEIEIEGANYNFQQDLDTAAFATGGVKVRF